MDRFEKELGYYKQIEQDIDLLRTEKLALHENQKDLTKQNEDLKIKFSQLLDQF